MGVEPLLAFPPRPAAASRLAPAALRGYHATQAALAANPRLAALLQIARGDDNREVKFHCDRRGGQLQLPVAALATAVRLLDDAEDSATAGWSWQPMGRTPAEQRRASKLAVAADAATRQAAAPADELDDALGGAGPGAATAQSRLAQRVMDGASLSDPETFKAGESYTANSDIEDIHARVDALVSPAELPVLERIVKDLVSLSVTDERGLQKALRQCSQRHKAAPRKSQLLHVLGMLVSDGALPPQPALRQVLVKKHSKSESGVLVITVVTSPNPKYTDPATGQIVTQDFSCEWDCHYCPKEPGQPRSYLHDEPSVLRANMNAFDAVLQFTDR